MTTISRWLTTSLRRWSTTSGSHSCPARTGTPGSRLEPGRRFGQRRQRATQRQVELRRFGAGEREPCSLARFSIDDDVGRRWSDLLATVEHPRRPDPVGPRATLHEGCLVDMAGEDNVGLVCLDPGDELGVAVEVLAVPACRRAGWRRVVDPYPG